MSGEMVIEVLVRALSVGLGAAVHELALERGETDAEVARGLAGCCTGRARPDLLALCSEGAK